MGSLGKLAQNLHGQPLALSQPAAQISVDLANENLLELKKNVKDYIKCMRSKDLQQPNVEAPEGRAPATVTAAEPSSGLISGYLSSVLLRLNQIISRNEIEIFATPGQNSSLRAEHALVSLVS